MHFLSSRRGARRCRCLETGLILGLPINPTAPSLEEGRPVQPSEVIQLGAQNPDAVGIEVFHEATSLVGLQLLVKATPASPSIADKPDSDYTYVRGIGPDSATALLASGGQYTFSPTKHIVNDGQRYGVEVQIVRTADGIMSLPKRGDFIKSV